MRTFNLSGYPVDLQKDENVKATAALLTRSGIPMDEARLRELVDKQYSAPYRAITVATNLTFAQVAEMIMDRDFKKALFITPVWKRTLPRRAVRGARRRLRRGNYEGGARNRATGSSTAAAT